MNSCVRWWKFNLVGAAGVVLQLGLLALLSRRMPGHYLFASVAALECTLLHNFVWHLHYTWRDRHDNSALAARLLRFHLSNGLVSLVGNVLLMRLLVEEARVPVIAANGIAILSCSIINFYLGENWTFQAAANKTQ